MQKNSDFALSYKVSISEAIDVVQDFFQISDSSITRSVNTTKMRGILNVVTLRSGSFLSRSNVDIPVDLDTLMYVINFKENEGFALVAADRRTSPIFAIVENGCFSFDSLLNVENEMFLTFINNAIFTELEDIINFKYNTNTRTIINGWNIRTYCAPILRTRWSQGGIENPNSYGKYCPNKSTGCVAIATAQILSNFKTIDYVQWKGENASGKSHIHWNQIISDCDSHNGELSPDLTPQSLDEIAHLCRYLGNKMDADYNKNTHKTSIDGEKAVDWFNEYGKLKASKFRSYEDNKIITALNENKLVLASGYSGKKSLLGFTKYTGGHVWVYDGYIDASKDGVRQNLLHCNWGWGGIDNGYYLSRVFDTNKGVEIADEVITRGVDFFYRYNLKYSVISQ